MWILLALTSAIVSSISIVIFKKLVGTTHYLVVASFESCKPGASFPRKFCNYSLGLLILIYLKKQQLTSPLITHWHVFLVTGILATVSVVAAFHAFLLTNVAYVTAIFKTNMFFTIILASIFLKEKTTQTRLGAALFMFLGVILLAV